MDLTLDQYNVIMSYIPGLEDPKKFIADKKRKDVGTLQELQNYLFKRR